jgi:hypothetical protein
LGLPALPHHRYFVILGSGADTAYLPSTVVGDRPGFLPCGPNPIADFPGYNAVATVQRGKAVNRFPIW